MTIVDEVLGHGLGKRSGEGASVVVVEAGGCRWDGVHGAEQEGGWVDGVEGGVVEGGVRADGVVEGVAGAVVRTGESTAAADSSVDPRTGRGHGQPCRTAFSVVAWAAQRC